jgi:hypothetical protein
LLAGKLAARRDNLVDTIAALELRLAAIKAPLFEPVAAYRVIVRIAKPSQAAFALSAVLQRYSSRPLQLI